MTFLNPALLILLPIAAVPILLHILSLRRLPVVELGTFRFLFDTYVQQRRRMKLHEIILAALRTLFVLLLVLVVSRPAVRQWAGLFPGGQTAVVIVDCSGSMARQTGGVSSLQRAQEAAQAIVERLAPGDRVTLIRLTNRPHVVFGRLPANAPEIRPAIAALRPSLARGNVYEGLAAVFRDYRSDQQATLAVITYLITDLQATGWSEVRAQSSALIPAGASLAVINVGSDRPAENLAVIGHSPEQAEGIVGLPLVLRPCVANYSDKPADVTVRVWLDEEEVAQFPLTLAPGESASRQTVYIPTEPGVKRGRFCITGDRFEADNELLFSLRVSGPVKVLLVNGDPREDPFEDEAVFLRTALLTRPDSSVLETWESDSPEAAVETLTPASLHVEEVTDGDWDGARLADISVMVLANCRRFFRRRQLRELRDYVRAGGGLIVFPGDNCKPKDYHRLLGSPGTNLPPLLPIQPQDPRGNPEDTDRYQQLAGLDYSHPVLSVLAPSGDSEYLATTRFYRTIPLMLPKAQTACWPLAQFTDGTPALIEGRFGQGKILMTAFPVTTDWSNLPLKPEFVPLVLRMVAHTRRDPTLTVAPTIAPEAVAEIRVAGGIEEPVATVTPPESSPVPIELQLAGEGLAGKFDQTGQKGFYLVDLSAQATSAADPERRLHAQSAFAVNFAFEESDLTTASLEDLHSWLKSTSVRLIDLSGIGASIRDELADESEIWQTLACLLFVVFVVEFALATLPGPSTETGAPSASGSLLTRLTGVRSMDEKS